MSSIKTYESMAKLELGQSERALIQSWADALEESFAALRSVDTEGVEPLVTVLSLQNVLREDNSARLISREELLSGAPEQSGGYFQVPRTLE